MFLCYSKFQKAPGVWSQGQAAELLDAGYYKPAALRGNIEGGTNIGPFHLECNATGTETQRFINRNGELVSPAIVAAAGTLGFYPVMA